MVQVFMRLETLLITWKWGESNRLVNVLGEDHKLQAKQVGLTLEELGQQRLKSCFTPSSNCLKAR